MNKKIIKSICFILILCILSISLTGCSENNGNESIQEKIDSELAYLDTKLIGMLNKANGISLENYIVKAEKINEQASNNDKNSQSDSSGGGQSSKETSGEETSNSSGANSNNSESTTSNVQYKMEGNEILLQDRTIDWESLKGDVEKLYSDWSTIELDLYKVGVNNQDILNFSTDLDAATQAIKSEDKAKTLSTIAKLYTYIPKYTSTVSNDTKTNNLYNTKSNVLNAYALVEQDDFSRYRARNEKCRTVIFTNY